ncbi:DedA family protein [Rhizobium sp. YIM 134829]|uniref:DedA family protein n=1 Tax=Rhizobium sp. YIM 134829 TaxID=3390453 RepID=UPI00397B71B0
MIEALVARYGVFGVLLGAGIEGEAVVFLGGVLAHRGLMPLWQVMIAAAIGSFLADQLFFALGRRATSLSYVQRLMTAKAMLRARDLLHRHPTGFILAFRFLYGMRIISPVLIGTTEIPTARFVLLNAVAACLWAVVISGVGYLFGNLVEALLGHLRLHLHLLIALTALALAGAALLLLRRRQGD